MVDERVQREIEFGEAIVERYLARQHGTALTSPSDADWWDTPGGKVRFERRIRMMAPLLSKADRCLEIGSGLGLWTEAIAAHVKEVIGIDVSPALVRLCAGRGLPNVRLLVMDAHRLEFPDESFDAAFCVSVLHHLDVEAALGEVSRVLKPGGIFLASEPNLLNPLAALERATPGLRRRFGVSPDEIAFVRWRLARQLRRFFSHVAVTNFDFYHPALGATKEDGWLRRGIALLESVPIVREISGSLFISCRK
jgi:SAM-dependent methyltransferase